jgi:hypothetical protein
MVLTGYRTTVSITRAEGDQKYCHVTVNIDGVWIIGFIEHLQKVTTNNFDSLTELQTPKIVVNCSTFIFFSVFTSRCLVAASNDGRSSCSEFSNYPRPQLPTSHSHNCNSQPKSKSKLCYDRRSVGQSVLVSSTHLWFMTTFSLLSDSYGFVLSDERTGLPFTIAAGPRQRSYSWVRVPWH